MSAPEQMKVRLAELPAARSITLDNAFVREAIAPLPIRAALERPADDDSAGEAFAQVDVYGEGDGGHSAFVRGPLRGWLEVACSRCVGTVRVAVEETIEVTYLPKDEVPDEDGDDDLEVGADDLDVYPYDGDELDLEPLLREQIVMAVPYAPLCREDCLGLCQMCGADKNVDPCQCDPEPIDPRLASLKDLKL